MDNAVEKWKQHIHFKIHFINPAFDTEIKIYTFLLMSFLLHRTLNLLNEVSVVMCLQALRSADSSFPYLVDGGEV